jgi:hypothetical protein
MCFLFLVILQRCPPGGVQIGLQKSDTPEAHTVRAHIFYKINLHDFQVQLHQLCLECVLNLLFWF